MRDLLGDESGEIFTPRQAHRDVYVSGEESFGGVGEGLWEKGGLVGNEGSNLL